MQTYSSLSNCKNRTSNSGAELGMDLRSSRHSEADPGAAAPSPVVTNRGFGQMVSGHKGAAPGTCSSGPMVHRTWPLGRYKEGPTVSWVPSFPSFGHSLTPNPAAYGQLTLRAQDPHVAWHSHPICTGTSHGGQIPGLLSSLQQNRLLPIITDSRRWALRALGPWASCWLPLCLFPRVNGVANTCPIGLGQERRIHTYKAYRTMLST